MAKKQQQVTADTKRPRADDVAVGHKIRIQRLALGMSQTALAAQLGVTFQQVQKYEKGVNRVGASRMMRIAKVLRVSVASLFPPEGVTVDEAAYSPAELSMLTTAKGQRMLASWEQLPHEMRDHILALVEEVVKQTAPAKG